jgi:hypothetical protein
MDSKLSKIELKNMSLETRLAEIEKEMTTLNSIQGSLSAMESHVTHLDPEVKIIKTDFRGLKSKKRLRQIRSPYPATKNSWNNVHKSKAE